MRALQSRYHAWFLINRLIRTKISLVVLYINYIRYYILICRIYCHVYSFFGRLTSKVIIYINGKNIELFTFISLYCRNKCLCYFYNTSFLGTFKIWVDFFDYLAHIEKKREKMLIFQYKSIVSLLKVGPSNMAAGLKSWRISGFTLQ